MPKMASSIGTRYVSLEASLASRGKVSLGLVPSGSTRDSASGTPPPRPQPVTTAMTRAATRNDRMVMLLSLRDAADGGFKCGTSGRMGGRTSSFRGRDDGVDSRHKDLAIF